MSCRASAEPRHFWICNTRGVAVASESSGNRGRVVCPQCQSEKTSDGDGAGFCSCHSGRGSTLDALQTTRDEVSRLAHVISEGAAQLRQWTHPPFAVSNMVS